MTQRATITLDNETFTFLNDVAGNNRSAYINKLLNEERRRLLAARILEANQEEADDPAYQEELAEWESTLSDGLS